MAGAAFIRLGLIISSILSICDAKGTIILLTIRMSIIIKKRGRRMEKKKVNYTLKYSKIFSTSRQNEIKADVLTLKWLLNEIYFCVITLGGN